MYQALVDFKYWTFIAQICNLLIQMLLFKKFLFKPVKAVNEKRRAEVGELYSQAEEARTTAEHDKAEYSKKLLEANEEASQIVRSANERAEAKFIAPFVWIGGPGFRRGDQGQKDAFARLVL